MMEGTQQANTQTTRIPQYRLDDLEEFYDSKAEMDKLVWSDMAKFNDALNKYITNANSLIARFSSNFQEDDLRQAKEIQSFLNKYSSMYGGRPESGVTKLNTYHDKLAKLFVKYGIDNIVPHIAPALHT